MTEEITTTTEIKFVADRETGIASVYMNGKEATNFEEFSIMVVYGGESVWCKGAGIHSRGEGFPNALHNRQMPQEATPETDTVEVRIDIDEKTGSGRLFIDGEEETDFYTFEVGVDSLRRLRTHTRHLPANGEAIGPPMWADELGQGRARQEAMIEDFRGFLRKWGC